jgi:AcrR family transcriptional regulator
MEKTSHNENTEAHIIETAKRLFLKNGYKNTNMCDIALETGINRTKLHYYFNTKEKMFKAVFSEIIESFLPEIQDILHKNEDFFLKIDKIIEQYIKLLLKNPYLPLFIIGEINRDIKHLLDAAYSVGLQEYLDEIKQTLTEEMKKGNIKTLPLHIIFMSFISQLIFPFLAKNIVNEILVCEDVQSQDIIQEWKSYLSIHVRTILTP